MDSKWTLSHAVTWTLKDWGSSRLYTELGPAEMLLLAERPVEILMFTLLKWQRADSSNTEHMAPSQFASWVVVHV